MRLTGIGELRAYLLLPFDCKWNALVRDVTAEHEQTGAVVDSYQVFKHLVDTIRQSGHLDHSSPERNRLRELFNEPQPPSAEQGQDFLFSTEFRADEKLWLARSRRWPWATGHGDTQEAAVKMLTENIDSLKCPNCGMPDGDIGNTSASTSPKSSAPPTPPDASKPCNLCDPIGDNKYCPIHKPVNAQSDAPARELVQRACKAYRDAQNGAPGDYQMTAAVAAALADRGMVEWERVEKAMREEWRMQTTADKFIAAVRKCLTKQEPVERVTISDGDCADLVCVLLDGKVQICQLNRVDAEIYAGGLRLKLEQQSQEGARRAG